MFKGITVKNRLGRSISMAVVCLLVISVVQFTDIHATFAATSGDAYINYDSGTGTWIMGTALGEQKVQFSSGKFLLKSFYNKSTSREYIEAGMISEEFRITANSVEYTGNSGGYTFDSYNISGQTAPSASPNAPGAIRLSVVFHNSLFKVTAYYEVYPSATATSYTNQSLIKKWFVFENVSGSNLTINSSYIVDLRVMQSRIGDLSYAWFEGGGHYKNYSPHWVNLNSTYYNEFNSDEVYADQVWKYNGSNCYSPFYVIKDNTYGEGIYVGFDYLGVWQGQIGNKSGCFFVGSKMKSYGTNLAVLAANATFQTPNCFMGVYKGDLDNVSEQLYDWQYVYRWDYTHENTGVSAVWNYQIGGNHDEQMFKDVNVCREVGANTSWEDAGWFETDGNWFSNMGDWIPSSADYGYVSKYAQKSNVGFRIWMPVQGYNDNTTPINEHPDWACNPVATAWGLIKLFDMGNDAAVNWMRDMLLGKRIVWNGAFQWRFDVCMTSPSSNNEYYKQYNNWIRLMKEVKTNDPNMYIGACSSGGEFLDWDIVEYADDCQLTDTNDEAGYYASQLYPSIKFTCAFGQGSAASMTQSDIDNTRIGININNYFKSIGILGRYSKVYHLNATGAAYAYDYAQSMSSDRSKAIVTQSHLPSGSVTVYPKALNPDFNYTVTFFKQKTIAPVTNTGSYWMTNGITITTPTAGEKILLNVPNMPGRDTDTTAPSAPSNATKKLASYLGHSGVEVNWTGSTDNNWMGYYEIFRGGLSIGKVSKGTFFFDYNGYNINSAYTVKAVDGDSNASSAATASYVTAGNNASQASLGFSSTQGSNGWSYMGTDGSTYINMSYDAANSRWYGTGNFCYVANNWMHPGDVRDSVRVYTAPLSGRIVIEGAAYKTDSLGDGVRIKIMKNGTQVWPASGWQTITNPTGVAANITTEVNAGDKIYFIVNRNTELAYDTLYWDPVLGYDKVYYKASVGFSDSQGMNNWSYQEYNGTNYVNMTWNATYGYWKGASANCIVANNWQHPQTYNSARVFTAPQTGNIIISSVLTKPQAGGDGVRVKIMKNSTQIWPASGWRSINITSPVEANVETSVSAGDKIYFVLDQNGDILYDGTNWNPVVTYK